MTDLETVIVAIDGPSGVGKSTVARLLAERLELPVLDTGAMYRAVALGALQAGIEPSDGAAIDHWVTTLELELRPEDDHGVAVVLHGEPVGDKIRTPAVSKAASMVSTRAAVRRRMVELQRGYAATNGAVLEGRDIGTVVFPHTPYKFFLTASSEVRAARRHEQLAAAGKAVDLAVVRAELESRDDRDSGRSESPLRCDDSYQVVDTSQLDIDQVVESMAQAVERSSLSSSEQPSSEQPGE